MKFLKNRKIALLITIAIIVFSTLAGVHLTVSNGTQAVERLFYDGIYLENEGYTQPSIDEQLTGIAENTLALAAILLNYPEHEEVAGQLLSARRGLLDAQRIAEKGPAYDALQTVYRQYDWTELEAQISDRRIFDVARTSLSTVSGAMIFIAEYFDASLINPPRGNVRGLSARYNGEVTVFIDGQSALTRVIGAFVPARLPDYFDGFSVYQIPFQPLQ